MIIYLINPQFINELVIIQSIFYLHNALCRTFKVLWSPPHFLPITTFMMFNAHFAFALTLSICSSQFSLLFKVIPKNWVLFLCDMIWFLSVISFLCFFMYSLYSNVLKLFKYLLSVDSVISFLNVKDNCSYFLLSFKFIKDFCCYF